MCNCRTRSWKTQLLLVQILYSAQDEEYTMLFHLDTPSFAFTSVGVAKAGDEGTS